MSPRAKRATSAPKKPTHRKAPSKNSRARPRRAAAPSSKKPNPKKSGGKKSAPRRSAHATLFEQIIGAIEHSPTVTRLMHHFIRASDGGWEQLVAKASKPLSEFHQRCWSEPTDSDPFGMSPAFLDFIRPFFQFLYFEYFRVETSGMRHVPKKGPVIFVANHSGALPYDGTMVHLALYNEHPSNRDVRFLVDDFVFTLPLVGTFVQRTGGVPASQENARRLLAAGDSIVVFPEGVSGIGKLYDERYRLKRFGHGGFVRLAMRTGVPIVPVSIIGAEEIHPIIWKSQSFAKPLGLPFIPFTPTFPWLGPLGMVPLPSKWQITFGETVDFSGFSETDAEDRALVDRHAERIRNTIQCMLDAGLRERPSIWV